MTKVYVCFITGEDDCDCAEAGEDYWAIEAVFDSKEKAYNWTENYNAPRRHTVVDEKDGHTTIIYHGMMADYEEFEIQ